MSSDRVLARASVLCTEESYSRKSNELAINPFAKVFHFSTLLERANLSYGSGRLPRYGNRLFVAEAKRRLCRHLRTHHLGLWEDREKPDWQAVKAAIDGCRLKG